MKSKVIRMVLGLMMLALIALCSTGCLFNLLQTARTVGVGNTAFTVGLGAILNAEYIAYLTPQGRLAIGLAQGVDLGLQSGLRIGMGPAAGDVKFLGAAADLKFSLVEEPHLLLAADVGGGYSHNAYRDKNGWGLSASAYCEPLLPGVSSASCCAGYRLHLPLEANWEYEKPVRHQMAFSLSLPLGPGMRLIVEVGVLPFENLYSFALGLEAKQSR